MALIISSTHGFAIAHTALRTISLKTNAVALWHLRSYVPHFSNTSLDDIGDGWPTKSSQIGAEPNRESHLRFAEEFRSNLDACSLISARRRLASQGSCTCVTVHRHPTLVEPGQSPEIFMVCCRFVCQPSLSNDVKISMEILQRSLTFMCARLLNLWSISWFWSLRFSRA